MNHSFDPNNRFPNSPRPLVPDLPSPNDEAGWVNYLIPRAKSSSLEEIRKDLRNLRRRIYPNAALESRIAETVYSYLQSQEPETPRDWAVWLVRRSENPDDWDRLLDENLGPVNTDYAFDIHREIIQRATHIVQLRALPFHGVEIEGASQFVDMPDRYRERRIDNINIFNVYPTPELESLLTDPAVPISPLPPVLNVTLRSDNYNDVDEMMEAMVMRVKQTMEHAFARPSDSDNLWVRVRLYGDTDEGAGMTGGIFASTRRMRLRMLSADSILSTLRPVMGSNANLAPEDFRYEFEFSSDDFRRGGASDGRPPRFDTFRGLLYIASKDGLCAARAILLATCSQSQRWNYNRPRRQKYLTRDASALGLPPFAKFIHMQHILDDKFPAMRIVLMTELRSVHPNGIFEGPDWSIEGDGSCDRNTIYLLLDTDSHYTWIRSINEFVRSTNTGVVNWCHRCLRLKNNRGNAFRRHKCVVVKCPGCFTIFETQGRLQAHRKRADDNRSVRCDKCYSTYPNEQCCDAHSIWCTGERSFCDECFKRLDPNREHRCGTTVCAACQAEYDPETEEHQCYNEPPKPDDPTKYCRHFAFDFESMSLKESITIGVGRKKKILVIYRQQVNFAAVEDLSTGEVTTYPSLETFSAFALNQTNSTFWAHNLKGYDGRLLYDYLTRTLGKSPQEITWNGSKIMAMKFRSVRFRDSLCHIASSLAAMPKIFGLDTSRYVKGDFPHLFNTPENQNYVGALPDKKYFDLGKKKPDAREVLLNWYDAYQGVWDFKQELKRYCIQDVKILAACLKCYQTEGLELNGIDPLRSVTCAGYAMKCYKSNDMPEHTIAVLTEEQAEFARRSLRGGRTDTRCLYKKYSEEELAQGIGACYVDVQSLYPFVQFTKPMPVGAPTMKVYDEEQPEMEHVMSFIGVIECDIRIVRRKFHPILVCKDASTGKLQADLYDKTRETFTSIELQAALRDGYCELGHVYRMLCFEPSTELFQDYIRKFLKPKVQCGGMPEHIQTDEVWLEYERYHRDVLGIDLHRDQMVPNKGKKALAKLMLNSLWGKFAERDHKMDTATVDAVGLHSLLAREDRGEIILKRKQILEDGTESKLHVEFMHTSGTSVLGRTNVALASFVSAWGRLVLWEEMNKLGDRVLYHDTDSIIFERRPGMYNTKEGVYLGDWESETGGKLIREFASIGPKTYAYRLQGDPDDKYLLKCKGFTLNYNNHMKLDFDKLKLLAMQEIRKVELEDFRMNYDKLRGGMYATTIKKELRFSYDKGLLMSDLPEAQSYKTYPFGWDRGDLQEEV